MKKYELTGEVKVKFGVTFKRIRALIDFGNVKKGELGGFIEKEENLSHENYACVYDDAWGSGSAEVYDDAWVYGNAWVYGDAWVYGNAEVSGNADYVLIGRVGSRYGFTTFFRNKNNFLWLIPEISARQYARKPIFIKALSVFGV